MTRCERQVPWLERSNLWMGYHCSAEASSGFSRMPSSRLKLSSLAAGESAGGGAAHDTTVPSPLATINSPESLAAAHSMPVPTIGASVTTSGTAWRCMFEPIRARFASSCSRNGISAVATLTVCLGDTSMYSMRLTSATRKRFLVRAVVRSSVKWLSLSSGAFACATTKWSSSSADRNSISSETQAWIGMSPAFALTSDSTRSRSSRSPFLASLVLRLAGSSTSSRSVRPTSLSRCALSAGIVLYTRREGVLMEADSFTGVKGGRQAALVRQLGQRIGLVHELRQLARPEELLDRRHHGACVDQAGRGHGGRVADRHALLDD